jgi:hypothetical protein
MKVYKINNQDSMINNTMHKTTNYMYMKKERFSSLLTNTKLNLLHPNIANGQIFITNKY